LQAVEGQKEKAAPEAEAMISAYFPEIFCDHEIFATMKWDTPLPGGNPRSKGADIDNSWCRDLSGNSL
jgi:hypothetical protein